jgi:hypothetical protein
MTSVLSAKAVAARGAAIGMVSVAVWVGALWAASRLVTPQGDVTDYLADMMLFALGAGVPAGLVAGALTARAVRLPHPWLVPLLGGVGSAVLLLASIQVTLPELPMIATWIEDATLVMAAYAGAALLSARGRRRVAAPA